MTDAEFEDFKTNNPELAKYFEINEEGEDLLQISNLAVPEVPESAPIFDQWEKAALRIISNILKNPKAYIFSEAVDVEALKIPDYH